MCSHWHARVDVVPVTAETTHATREATCVARESNGVETRGVRESEGK